MVKRRQLEFSPPLYWEEHKDPTWTTSDSPEDNVIYKGYAPALSSTQTTYSESHEWPPKGTRVKDAGGNFSTAKVTISGFRLEPFHSRTRYGESYHGPAFAFPMRRIGSEADIASIVPFSTDAQLNALGAKAIARCIPTNPVVDGATFIGELKAGLPKMVGKELYKTKFKDYRKVGDEYLNVEFGWKPLISDLMSAGKAVTESEKILGQLHRDSGRLIRRQYSFPDEISTTTFDEPNQYCWVPSNLAMSTYMYRTGILRRTVTRTTKTWFSGAFTYHLNLGNTLQDKIARQSAEARKLFGLELTPSTVWNLAPWSWIVDWEGNIGDVLHNVSRFSQDGLVMPYGYIMQEKHCVIDMTLFGGIDTGQTEDPLTLRVHYVSKIRRKATPFGFGFDMQALTGRQSAILAALGISRAPRK